MMADNKHKSTSCTDDGGPQEEGDSVKTKPVSCSTVGGHGTAIKRTSKNLTAEDEDESSAEPPAPRKVSKIGLNISSKVAIKSNPISIKLGAAKPKEPAPTLPPKRQGLAAVFDDDDSEPEEMPPEAKMRMKNIGRETPTSAGPNSFNKGKQGFSDHQKLWERKLKSQTDDE
ncbi:PEST proteolytic signal-containing nuclear protein [Menidia menidia]